MNGQREFMSETFHTLAQPITALRAMVEIGLRKEPSEQASRQTLENCLQLIDRLMQDLAVFREITSLDEEPSLASCDGQALLRNCVEEMAIIAQAGGVTLHLNAEPALMQCNAAMFQRAIFVLLDEMIACTMRGGEITISLRSGTDGWVLEMRPGTLPGQRQKLSHKLMQFAGGRQILAAPGCTAITFRKSELSGNSFSK